MILSCNKILKSFKSKDYYNLTGITDFKRCQQNQAAIYKEQ